MIKQKLPYLFLIISLVAFIILFGDFGIPSLAQMGGPPGIGQFAPIDAFYVLTQASSGLSNSVLTTKLTTDLIASTSGKNLGSSLAPWDNVFGLIGRFTQIISSQIGSLGSLAISSGGTNQNISLQPSGAGKVTIGGDSLIVASLASDPATSSSQAGQIYFNTTINKFRGFNGTNWQTFVQTAPEPPTIDSVSTGTVENAQSISVTHTINGANRLLIAFVSTDFEPSTTPTYAGMPMSLLNVLNLQKVYYLIAPPTGTNNFVWTGLPGPTCGAFPCTDATVALVSVNGVNQTVPLGPLGTATGVTADASIVVNSSPSDLIIDHMFLNIHVTITPPVADSSQIERWNIHPGGGAGLRSAGSTKVAVENSTTMNWTVTIPGNQSWDIQAVAIKPVNP